MLQLQVAVPPTIDEGSVDEATAFILGAIESAIEAGVQRLSKARVEFDEKAMRRWIQRMKTRLVH